MRLHRIRQGRIRTDFRRDGLRLTSIIWYATEPGAMPTRAWAYSSHTLRSLHPSTYLPFGRIVGWASAHAESPCHCEAIGRGNLTFFGRVGCAHQFPPLILMSERSADPDVFYRARLSGFTPTPIRSIYLARRFTAGSSKGRVGCAHHFSKIAGRHTHYDIRYTRIVATVLRIK